MKKLTMKVSLYSAAALVLSAAPAFAQQTGHVSVKVPFDFTAGSTALPAGEYTFQDQTNGVVLIMSPSQHKSVLVLTNPESVIGIAAHPSVKFDKVGEQYTLSEIDITGEPGRKLLKVDHDSDAIVLASKLGVTNASSKGLSK